MFAPAGFAHEAAHFWCWLACPRAQNQPRGETLCARNVRSTLLARVHVTLPLSIRTE